MPTRFLLVPLLAFLATATPLAFANPPPTSQLEEITSSPQTLTPLAFSLQKGHTLEQTLQSWTSQAGWTLSWKIPPSTPDILFESNYTLPTNHSTSLVSAVDHLFKTLKLAPAFKAHFYTGNNTLVITP